MQHRDVTWRSGTRDSVIYLNSQFVGARFHHMIVAE